MKRVVYVSTLNKPEAGRSVASVLLLILNTAKVHNKTNDITGVLLVSGNTCLQVLEGPSQALAHLMYRINRDTRHRNVKMVINTKIEKRIFNQWNMKLIPKGSEAEPLILDHLRKGHPEVFFSKVVAASARMKVFFPDGVTPRSAVKTKPKYDNPYEGMALSITAWPSPKQLRLTTEIVRLCSCLTKKPVPFNDLVMKGIYQNQAQLVCGLNEIKQTGILQLRTKPLNALNTMTQTPTTGGQDRFSQVLRRFIDIAKR